MAGGRLTKKESDHKKRQGKTMFVNSFSQNEVADVLEVHLETIKKWYKNYAWQDARDIRSLSISELKQETLRSFATLKASETHVLSFEKGTNSPDDSPDSLENGVRKVQFYYTADLKSWGKPTIHQHKRGNF